MASKYLEQMAHDKYFLTALYKDERIISANKKGSKELRELARSALADIEKRQVNQNKNCYRTSLPFTYMFCKQYFFNTGSP